MTAYKRSPVYEKTLLFVNSASGEEVSIFVPEDEEPKTEAEKIIVAIGFKKADKAPPNIAMGIIGIVMLVIPAVVLFSLDFNTFRIHFRFMKRNIQHGQRNLVAFHYVLCTCVYVSPQFNKLITNIPVHVVDH